MRSFDQAIQAWLAARDKEPRFVMQVSYSASSADDVYVVSHSGITFAGSPTILDARVETVSALSQQIFPDEGRSTIGSMSFEALDTNKSLTTSQRTNLLTNARGLRFKTVKFWLGFKGQAFAEFALYATQMLAGVVYDSGVYSFQCSDIQRDTKPRIFDRVTLRLASDIDAATTTIPITGDTSQIVALEHDSAWSDAPSATVAYIKIDDEIIRIPAAGIVANQFTGVTRGALGTIAAEHTTDASSLADKKKEVEEQIYLELNAVKLLYAILTGALIGQTGTMPPTWNAGVSGSFIDSTSFTGIGTDLYDGTVGGGVRLRFLNPTAGEAKRFCEQQICSVFGLYLFVKADGQLALRRLEEVLHAAAPVGFITDRELIDPPVLQYAYNLVQNRLQIDWNFVNGDATRTTAINDANSIAVWGASDVKKLRAEGLHGQIHSADALRSYFQRFRSRYAGPPIKTRIKTRLECAKYEVGDIVMVRTATAVDHTDPVTTSGLLRSFEVQGTTINWQEGSLTLDLFGSTMAAAPITRENENLKIADSWFTSGGTDIESLGHTSRVGSVVTWNSTGTFTGNASLASAILRCNGDLVIGAGVRLDITQNVQLRVKGVLTVNGEIRGIGAGLAGVADTLDASGWPLRTDSTPPIDQPYTGVSQQLGTAGYYGSPRAGGGLFERIKNPTGSHVNGNIQSFQPLPTAGKVDIVPTYVIDFDGTKVTGIPDDLRGSSGGPGGRRHYSNTTPGPDVIEDNNGGTGGAGGAGLLVVCRGMAFGASGKVDLSGGAGALGGYNAANEFPAHGGAGAGGAPGALICIVDGVLNPVPILSNATVPAKYGAVPLPTAGTYNIMTNAFGVYGDGDKYGGSVPINRISYFAESPTNALTAGVAASRAMYLYAPTTPTADGTDDGLAAAQSITLALTQNPLGTGDEKQTAVTATVTLVSVTAAYALANIYARHTGDTAPGRLVAQADNVATFLLPADAAGWTITAIPVLLNLIESTNPANWATATVTTPKGATMGVFPIIEDFSDNDLTRAQNRWAFVNYNVGEQSIVAETGTPPPVGGQYVYECGNNSGDDMVSRGLIGPNRELVAPIERNVLYRIIFWARRAAGSGVFYFGVSGYAADRTTSAATGTGGNPAYCAASGLSPADTAWHAYVGYFKQTGAAAAAPASLGDPLDPYIIGPDAAFIFPFYFVNYSGATGRAQLAYVRVDRVGQDGEIPTDTIAQGAVTARYLQTTAGPTDIVVTAPSLITYQNCGYIDIPKPPPDESLAITINCNGEVLSGDLSFILLGCALGNNDSTTIFADVGHSISSTDTGKKAFSLSGTIEVVDPFFGSTDWTDPVRAGIGIYVNVPSGGSHSCTYRLTNMTVQVTRFKR